MAVNESDVFESLDGCDEALDDGWEREKCYGGVFMENVTAINNPEPPLHGNYARTSRSIRARS